jgi:glyoxylase-like metal-dependent hydrolase (beta-lactamase superfamily II)
MKLLDKRSFLELISVAAGLSFVSPTLADLRQAFNVFTSDVEATLVDSVIIVGEKKAVLIDSQMDRRNASALADRIAATGRRLETILITHLHPDHFLGLGVLLERFPDARPVAHKALQPVLANAGPAMFNQFKSRMGPGLADRVIIPEPLNKSYIDLEGERIDVLDPMHGDTAIITPVHIRALDLLITSDIAFAGTHAYVAENTTPEALATWRASLSLLESIGAKTIVPGHRLANSANDAGVFAHTRQYLNGWEAALAEAGNAQDLRAALLARVGDLPVPFFVDRAVGAVFG